MTAAFDPSQIMNLVGQLGGDHQHAAQQLQGVDQVDPQQQAGMLSQVGIDPQELENGGYQQHLDAQQHPDFQGYQQGSDPTSQQTSFPGQPGGGYEQDGGDDQDRSQQGF